MPNKDYYEANKERILQQQKKYRRKYYEANKEQILQRHREYAKKYRDEEYILERYRQRQKTYQDMLESQQLAKEFYEKIKGRVGHVYN